MRGIEASPMTDIRQIRQAQGKTMTDLAVRWQELSKKTCKNPICAPLIACKKVMDEFSAAMERCAYEEKCLADALQHTQDIQRNKRNRRKRERKKQRSQK